MIGPDAGEVLATVHTAMLAELPYPTLRDAVLAHPTMAEGLGPSCRACHLVRTDEQAAFDQGIDELVHDH
jgi:hypothetical protein